MERVGEKLFQATGRLKLRDWAQAVERDAKNLPIGKVASPNAKLDAQWDREERYGGGRRRPGRKKKDLG